jgi:hypothetical protein
MVAYYAGKPVDTDSDEFVMVTIWNCLADLKSFAGDDWQKVVIPEEEVPLLKKRRFITTTYSARRVSQENKHETVVNPIFCS